MELEYEAERLFTVLNKLAKYQSLRPQYITHTKKVFHGAVFTIVEIIYYIAVLIIACITFCAHTGHNTILIECHRTATDLQLKICIITICDK